MLVALDPDLAVQLAGQDCDFIYKFTTPIHGFEPSAVTSLNSSISFFDCKADKYDFSNDVFEKSYRSSHCQDYQLYYSGLPERREDLGKCYRSENPVVEWNMSFNDNSNFVEFSLLSVAFTHRRRPDIDCFGCRISGGVCRAINASENSSCSCNLGCSHGKKSLSIMAWLKGKKLLKWQKLVIVTSLTVGVMIFLSFTCIIWKNKRKYCDIDSVDLDSLVRTEFYLMDIKTAKAVTNHFADTNKLGQGGFGSVYKGVLADANEIAIKRLSSNSTQGAEEFKNEVKLISQLQHKNLVKLLGCCVEGGEKLIIYEYLPNGSLDTLLVDQNKRSELDWETRKHIILGITRGLIYLHEDSQLKVVHRDLKPSNILLDLSMNTKISDFGLARIFDNDTNEVNTNRLVGTFGYMAPEFAMAGLFSAKSDVFGFGVLLLEIISAQRNGRLHFEQYEQSLLIRAWQLWKEKQGADLVNELVDPSIRGKFLTTEAIRWIQIALLCVQDNASDRPKMSTVLRMFETEQMELMEPLPPPYFTCHGELPPLISFPDMPACTSTNMVTMTEVEVR